MVPLQTNVPTIIQEVSDGIYVDHNGQTLTDKQIRHVVTPHDFNVSSSLVGHQLARPWRRGLAIAIDGLLITMLAGGGLPIFVPLYLYLIWCCHKLGVPNRRNILLALMPIMLILVFSQGSKVDIEQELTIEEVFNLGTSVFELKEANCDVVCAEEKTEELLAIIKSPAFSDDEVENSFRELLSETVLSEERQKVKLQKLQSARAELKAAQQQLDNQTKEDNTAQELSWWQKLKQSDHSVVKMVQGIFADLGVSVGWAILYFTLFISWNAGQTPGKQLLKIKVVQRNNQPLSLWAAFGRQGGYSAGFATGLLGFFQIYWDPNRQAIQDKVAETLVLKL